MNNVTKDDAARSVAGLLNCLDKIGALAEEAHASINILLRAVQQLGEDMTPFSPYSQRDPAWNVVPLGSGSLTIGQAGCLMCCVASACSMNPWQMNEWLKTHGGFVDGNLFVFASIQPLGWTFDKLVDCPTPESTPIPDIRRAIASGGLVIAKVDSDQSQPGVQEHWIRILAVTEDGTDAMIYDPWLIPSSSTVVNTSKRFGDSLALALWRVAFYSHGE